MAKEKLYTIPLNDAVNADDECALCNVVRALERDAIDFVVGPGASYMQDDIRSDTDKTGFCRHHFQMMFEYGNSLGNALILSTHTLRTIDELRKQMKAYRPGKSGLFGKSDESNVEKYLSDFSKSCYVCNYYSDTYKRYIDTFFYLYESDDAFRDKIINGKGFCLNHMNDLVKGAYTHLKKDKADEFCKILFDIEEKNLNRIQEDISWFVEKFDYRNKDADWKNSKDAIPRTIQKLAGGYPADGSYKQS